MIETRLAAPTSIPWTPLPYMTRAVDFLCTHLSAGLPLKPGGRKTSITLAAFCRLKAEGKVSTMLVVAPLRVARQVWRQEGRKWTDFNHLRFALVHGDVKARKKALESGADVYLINYEGLEWLAKQYDGRPLPFDIVVFDELTRLKNSQSQRSKAIRPRLSRVGYRWGLTGSLFSKGHMDIFGQQLVLDDGAALGRFMTHYRDKYFTVGWNGFDYNLLPGSEQRIVEKLAPYWFYMSDADYSELPPLIDVPHIADFDTHQRSIYDRMKRDALVSIGADTITAANAGAVYSKLAQLANGAIYRDGHTSTDEFHKVHDLKLDMLEDLLEELAGEPLLLAYEFQSDMHRIQERFGKLYGGQVPYLGAGTTPKQEDQWVRAWNARELPLLCAHPQSAGHGLNMQEGQAYNVAWFSVAWDWELYDQFIRRVRRSGNEQARIFNHLLIIRGTIDDEKLKSVAAKDFTERRLLGALNTQILREAQGNTETDMVAKLTRPGEAQQGNNGGGAPAAASGGWGGQGAQPQQQAPAANNGGGAPGGWGQAPDNTQQQRERIQEKIAPDAGQQRSAFSGNIAEQAAQVQGTDYGPTGGQQPQPPAGGGWGAGPGAGGGQQQVANGENATTAAEPPKTRAPRTKKEEADPQVNLQAVLISARAHVLSAVIDASAPDDTVADIVDLARDFMVFVVEG